MSLEKQTIGLAKEIKTGEARVALSPQGVEELVRLGVKVKVEQGAGAKINYQDGDYLAAGADIVSRDELFSTCGIIVKVKELQPPEIKMLQKDQILFCYLHLAPDPEQTNGLIEKKVTAIAFETITDHNNTLPLLTPMSQVAGKMSVQQSAYFLTNPQGGSGILLSGVAGSTKGKVTILGGGVVGTNAAAIAIGYGANVTIIDKSLTRLRYLEDIFGSSVTLLYSSMATIRQQVIDSDIVIGGVLIPGAAAPKLLDREILRHMKPGTVIADVAIDQGGCFETSRPTTHLDPIYNIDGITHYCVANIPGAAAKTASMALEASILPYVIKLGQKGLNALKEDKHFLNGLNIFNGNVTYKAVADALGHTYQPAETVF